MKTLHYPTYSSYRALAEESDLAGIGEGIRYYREKLTETACPNIRQCYADALRAYEDELLSREYCTRPDGDDPFFEDDVRGYEPGDMIDFYS